MSATREHSIEPFFLHGTRGRLFCLFVSPSGDTPINSAVLHLPAFAEEMNKSRPMVARQARQFAQMGIATLIFDYFGTGDSDGEFHDANWDTWVRDTETCIEWLDAKGISNISLWGNRIGAGIALDALVKTPTPIDSLVLWQPVVNGQVFLKQFLRLRRAAEMFYDSSDGKSKSPDPENEPVEVAGYMLQPDMADALGSVSLAKHTPGCHKVAILEVSSLPEPALSRPTKSVADSWAKRGIDVEAQAVPGEPYWSTLENTTNLNMLQYTERYFARGL